MTLIFDYGSLSYSKMLEEKIQGIGEELHIKHADGANIESTIKTLFDFHQPLANHSMRVAIISYHIGKEEDVKALKGLFLGSLSHDIGKTKDISVEYLNRALNDEEYEIIKKHTINGYEMLKGINMYYAILALSHHKFGDEPYPAMAPEVKFNVDDKPALKKAITILSISDFYDAAKTRRYKKFEIDLKNTDELKNLMMSHYKNDADLVERCFSKGIFR